MALHQHSYEDHIGFLREGGVLLYDSDNVQPDPNKKQFVHVGVPITGLTIEALGGSAKDKGRNIFVLGLLARIFHLDTEKLKKLIAERFSGKSGDVANTASYVSRLGLPIRSAMCFRAFTASSTA